MRRWPALALLLLVGCGVDGAPAAGTTSGALQISARFDREPLTRTGNRLRVHLTDSSGQPVVGAAVTISVVMSAHGHDAVAPAVQELDGGEYLFEPINFTMAGSWRVSVSTSKGALQGEQSQVVIAP